MPTSQKHMDVEATPSEIEKILWCVERMLDGTYKSADHKKLDILNYLTRLLTTQAIQYEESLQEAYLKGFNNGANQYPLATAQGRTIDINDKIK